MPIQTLGLFDRVFNWVYDKLLSPVISWLSEILGNIFKEIFEVILLPFLQLVFGTLWDAIVTPILDFFYRGIYAIYSGLLWIVELVEQGFDVLIGLQNISYLDEASGEVMETTLLNYIIFDDSIRNVLIAVTLIAMVLCIAFSIYSVMRSSLDFDFENKRPVGKVMTMTAKSMLTFLMIPLIVWVGLNLASHALVATATALSGGQPTSISDTILAISSMDASRGDAAFALTNEPWSGLMDGSSNAFTFALDVHISKIDYLVGFVSAIFCLIIMIMCLFTFIRRIYDIVVLYIVSPYFASTMVLDDGQKFSSWRDTFIAKVLIGFGSAIGMRIFLMLVPIIMGDEIQLFDSTLMNATGGYVLKLIFVLGGMYAVYKSSSLLTSIVNSRVGSEEANSSSRMLRHMGHGVKKLGGAAASALMGSGALGRTKGIDSGNKQPIPAGAPSGLNTGAPSAKLTTGFTVNGATGATAEQSREWQKALGDFDPDSDYSQTRNMHIRDVEDMSESLQNLFGDDIVKGNDVEDMSKELSDLFDEKPGLDLGSFIKDDYSQPEKSSSGSITGDLSGFIKDDYFAESKTDAADSKSNSAFDLSGFLKDDYSTDTGSKGTGAEGRGSVTGDLSGFVRDDYHVSPSAVSGSLSVGGQSFAVPEGYVAMPKIVPQSKAQARVQQMKQSGGAQFGAYYDAVSSQMKKGSYSTPAMSSNISQIQSVSSVGGKQLHVPEGYTVVPEIMKVSDATVAASSIRGGKNQEFYSAFTSAINSPVSAASAPTPTPAPKITTSWDIASLEAQIQTNTSDN